MDVFVFMIVVCGLSIPLTLIGTYHARKMAEIERRGTTSENEAYLQSQIDALRQLVTQQAIVLDDVATMNRRLLDRNSTDSAIQKRLDA